MTVENPIQQPSQPSSSGRPLVVFIFNSTIPYNQHLCRRLASEMTHVDWHFVFTKPGGQWEEDWPAESQQTFLWEAFGLDGGKTIPPDAADQLLDIPEPPAACILSGYASPFLRRLAKLCLRQQIPYFVRADSNIKGESRLPAWKRILKRWLIGPFLARAAGTMPMGRMGVEYFARYGGDRQTMFIVPHEPDHQQFENRDEGAIADFREQNHLDPQRKFLLCCNRLVPVKRVDLVIDGFVRVAEDFPDWDLIVLGQGPLETELADRVPSGLRHRVHWLGFRQLPEVILVFQLSHVFILASNYEPWATVIGEAAAAGLPIIASDAVGAAHEVVKHGHSGWLFPSENLDGLVAGLRDILPSDRFEDYRRAIHEDAERWRREGDPVAGIAAALAQCADIAVPQTRPTEG